MLVRVNKVGAICKGNCEFQFTENIPIVTSAVLTTDHKLNVVVSYANFNRTNSIELNEFTVSLGNTRCLSLSGSITDIVCVLPENADRSLKVKAGSYSPLVWIDGVGAAKSSATLQKVLVPLVLTSFAPISISPVGGQHIIVRGNGFPLNSSDASTAFKVIICNKELKVNSVNSTHINVTVPSCSDMSTTISV